MKLYLLILLLFTLNCWAQEIQEDLIQRPVIMEEDSRPVSYSYQMNDPEMLPEQEVEMSPFEDPDREYTYEEIPEAYQ